MDGRKAMGEAMLITGKGDAPWLPSSIMPFIYVQHLAAAVSWLFDDDVPSLAIDPFSSDASGD